MSQLLFPQREYHVDGSTPGPGRILVFGSNTGGRHGAGAARLAAIKYGAVEGVGEGRTGNAYAIPTKIQLSNGYLLINKLEDIRIRVAKFVEYTHERNDLEYFLTSVGCGYAGYAPVEIAPLFREAYNCSFPQEWKHWLDKADAKLR